MEARSLNQNKGEDWDKGGAGLLEDGSLVVLISVASAFDTEEALRMDLLNEKMA